MLYRDILRGDDPQVGAVVEVVAHVDPDILLLLDVDWDLDNRAVAALRAALAEAGASYDHSLSLRPNAGLPSGFDLDGNGRLGEGRDALGYGRFTGDGGMVLLSRYPLGPVTDLSGLLWADAGTAAAGLLPSGAEAVVPLATVGQWVVPVRVGALDLTLVTLNASTPVFDGPEDRNGLRNREELAFVGRLAGEVVRPVVLGRANIDPLDGAGDRDAMAALLSHPALQDPQPRGAGGGGAGHRGDSALDTVAFEGPGPLRVDYVLPAADLTVRDAGVLWPPSGDPLAPVVAAASRGRLVWVDIALP